LTAAGGIVPAMLVRPVPPPRRPDRRAGGRRTFTLRSDLGATILHMISTHSLPAFTPAIDRTAPAQPPRDAAAPVRAIEAAAHAAQRALEAVPAQPGRPLPRGSLLDLRV
jgi:hypothetical protein